MMQSSNGIDKKSDVEKITDEINLKKYRWLHRIHVSAFLYLPIQAISKLLGIPNLRLLYILLIAYYLIFPERFDNIFPFNKRFYKITGTIAGLIVILNPNTPGATPWMKNFFGWVGYFFSVFMFFNSLFVLSNVLKLDLKKVIREKIWE